MGALMAAAAPHLSISLSTGWIPHATTHRSNPAIVRFPSLGSFCKVVCGEEPRFVRGGGLLSHSLAAIMMDGGSVTVNEEMQEAQRETMDRCVKAVLFDLDDTLVLTHAVDKVAQQAARVSESSYA